MAYVRTVKTASGATAVQVVYSSRRGSRSIEHIGSAHDETGLAALKAAAAQRLARGQGELELGLTALPGGRLEIVSSATHLWDALCRGYDALGFPDATGGDEVFRHLVLARIVEPSSKLDALRVLAEAGVAAVSYATLKRRLPVYAEESWRRALAGACARRAALGPASLVLYDVSTLHFETDAGDGFREPGVLQGAPARPADHHRAAHRRRRVSAHGRGVRREQGGDPDDAPHDHRVHGRSPAA